MPQVRRAPAREPRQDLAGSSAKRCPVSLRGAWGTFHFRPRYDRSRPQIPSQALRRRRRAVARATALKGAIARGRVATAISCAGPRGSARRRCPRARHGAQLRATRRSRSGEPCGDCASCQRIWSGSSSLDVVEIDAAANRGVDDARELRERAMYAPSGDDHYKVYIVDEAHMLTREAWNALLKILEEPPPRVVFVFATTEPQKIAQTAAPVLSRLQRFDFKRIGPARDSRPTRAVLATRESRPRRTRSP